MTDQSDEESRRRFVKAGTATAAALGLGATGNAAARVTQNETENGNESETDGELGDAEQFRDAIATRGTYYSGAVFRVVSPPLQDAPGRETPDVVRDHEVRVFELFNTNEEGFLFVPPENRIEEGEQYVFDDQLYSATVNEPVTDDLVRVRYRPLTGADLPFDLDEVGGFETADGGGEAVVRPDDFFGGALFEITSGPQGWIPDDVEQSGLFTDYNTVHAEYLGTNENFLLFAHEEAATETGQLYVMRDEGELLDPPGNLVAAEFNAVDEDSVSIDDELLR
ncbi:hypothetical protein [Halopiger xanaduensis]|uniref:Uncharacterized protein n=1 Tax=Halopiger xanaduensis (strain DSM 18323 / JCM 14033 / SH-6) TaxID=797210 RepID=F8D5Z8_HALXS|nr:hypothetical protein [Halopiger xanaduensis]AEH37728.1 hypothetical protein Halxa_3114 [Halopiger xanaduensis SH-6]